MATPPLNPSNIQGDITVGFTKKAETLLFFNIDNPAAFRRQLAILVPKITTATQVSNHRAAIAAHKHAGKKGLVKTAALNIAFSQFGLNQLGINDDIGDEPFKKGQVNTAVDTLNDKSLDGKTPDWIPPFRNAIHGILIAAGDCKATVVETVADAVATLRLGTAPDSICHEVIRLQGGVRPGKQEGHEHFGFRDGISNPAVTDIDTKQFHGQPVISPKVILLGRDENIERPSWALDGSFLAFRYLHQLVPEFNDFLLQNALPLVSGGQTPEEGAEFLGARMVGRWKSGAPLDLSPVQDAPELGKDPQRNNNFSYNIEFDGVNQDRCPFAAHIRKTNPRSDLQGGTPERHHIMRRGIPFGPELTGEEKQQKKTLQERGLLFRCYQSNISDGFEFIQQSWANDPRFIFGKPVEVPGFDPIIGQASGGNRTREITGVNPQDQGTPLQLHAEWVVSKGGEYFFSPSISALKETFAKA